MRPPEIEHSRACLKKAFCKMCVTVCGRFCLNEGGVAGYVNRMKVKYAAKWGVQIAGMIFQTRSRRYYFYVYSNRLRKLGPQRNLRRLSRIHVLHDRRTGYHRISRKNP